MIEVRTALPGDLPAAVEVWHAANVARGLPPPPQRRTRITEKLAAPDAHVLIATLPAAAPGRAASSEPDAALGRQPGPAGGAPHPAHGSSFPSGGVPVEAGGEPLPAGGVPVAAGGVPLPAGGVPVAAGGGSEVVVGMALVEPGRAGDGTGDLIPGHGHVSMVFVDPSHWSQGYGRHLLRAVHALGYTRTTLWTRQSNARAQRLYAAAGYTPTGRTAHLADGDAIIQLEHR
ncbi:GNAT family N-acetyltransferase [Dactylosporangium sp. NPDC005555]|uniref:GNAT family N-acetyltransferase n=1 Tax=Dactylosporangium sp. NPDC005555 TaxID=3154889 RepID=UPI0033A22184